MRSCILCFAFVAFLAVMTPIHSAWAVGPPQTAEEAAEKPTGKDEFKVIGKGAKSANTNPDKETEPAEVKKKKPSYGEIIIEPQN
ncbi:MAG: hypothetical protein KKB70_06420 [Proteobacteria bacterium]|nr:hypothetical protein [Pseudomonadota bacterium]MBU1611268.1 hypothetical protein [Pseudomonadota bacterium]